MSQKLSTWDTQVCKKPHLMSMGREETYTGDALMVASTVILE